MSAARIVIVALMFASQLTAFAQKPPTNTDPGTGLIVGTVIDAVSGAPLGGVVVVLTSTPRTTESRGEPVRNRAVVTGADGRFMFARLHEGGHWLNTERSGYVRGGVATTSPDTSTATIDLKRGEAKTDLVVRLWRTATIGGIVTDETGAPAIGVTVGVERRDMQDGHALFRPVFQSGETDDRGVYRIPSLEPGDYLVFVEVHHATLPTSILEAFYRESVAGGNMNRWLLPDLTNTPGSPHARQVGPYVLQTRGPAATPSDATGAPRFVYASTFYPGVTNLADASVLHIATGASRSDVNFQLRPVPTIRITGTLIGPEGPLARTRMSLVAAGSSARSADFEVAGTTTDTNGTFAFLNVPAGQYTIDVLRNPHRTLDDSLEEATRTGETVPGELLHTDPRPDVDANPSPHRLTTTAIWPMCASTTRVRQTRATPSRSASRPARSDPASTLCVGIFRRSRSRAR